MIKRENTQVIGTNGKWTYKKDTIIKRYIYGRYIYIKSKYNLIADAYGEKTHIEKKHT